MEMKCQPVQSAKLDEKAPKVSQFNVFPNILLYVSSTTDSSFHLMIVAFFKTYFSSIFEQIWNASRKHAGANWRISWNSQRASVNWTWHHMQPIRHQHTTHCTEFAIIWVSWHHPNVVAMVEFIWKWWHFVTTMEFFCRINGWWSLRGCL